MSVQHPRVVIVGGSFAGLTAAYELKRRLGKRARVTVIDKNDELTGLMALPRPPGAEDL